MVRIHQEEWNATKVERALLDAPYDGKALQLNSGVSLLGWGEPLGSAVHNLEHLFIIFVTFYVSEGVSQAEKA